MRFNLPRLLMSVAVICSPLAALGAGVTGVTKELDGVLLKTTEGTLRLQVWADSAIRVTYASGTALPALKSFAVVSKPNEQAKWTLRETPDAVFLGTPAIQARVDRNTAAITFTDPQGKMLLQESPNGREFAPSQPFSTIPNTNPQPASLLPADATLVRQSFVLPPDEGIYGLGQHQQGAWNYQANGGRAVRLLQQNTEVGIPVLLSSKQYVLFWDNPAVTEISVGAPAGGRGRGAPTGAGENVVRWSSEVGKAVDYYFCFGGTAEKSMAAYRALTGNVPMLPRWAWGFLHSKERYRSQAEMMEVANEFRKNNIPIDTLIQDWRYWPDDTWGSHQFDKTRYPDPAAMFKDLHDLHYHAIISVWPKFDLGTPNFNELEKAGAFYEPVIPYVYPPGRGKWYDPMSQAGRETYWKQLATQLSPLGADGWWLDAPEPELSGKWGEYRYFKTAAGPGAEVFNAYPLMHSAGIYEGQRAQFPEKRVIILTRSAWAGQQRNSALTWSGDIGSSWQVFKNQIPAGLNFVSSGIPYWNTDTGGFFNNAATGNMLPTDPRYQEIFTRWFQFSAFCPMFRVHGTGQNSGTGIGKEIYRFPEEPRKNLLAMLNLRYRLLPYIYSTAWQVTSNGSTMMRPLVMDFANDAKVLNIADQYLFGPAVMVSPVTAQGATTRDLYLPSSPPNLGFYSGNPAGGPMPDIWYDFWTGKKEIAGKPLTAAAPISQLPLFIRAGSILPLGPLLQYTADKPADPLELRIYRGRDGAFTLYEDEGDSYRYEKGQCATIPFTWNDVGQILTIGERKGDFPGILKSRTFHIVFVSENHGTAIPPTEKPDQVITYTGAAVTVKSPL